MMINIRVKKSIIMIYIRVKVNSMIDEAEKVIALLGKIYECSFKKHKFTNFSWITGHLLSGESTPSVLPAAAQ